MVQEAIEAVSLLAVVALVAIGLLEALVFLLVEMPSSSGLVKGRVAAVRTGKVGSLVAGPLEVSELGCNEVDVLLLKPNHYMKKSQQAAWGARVYPKSL